MVNPNQPDNFSYLNEKTLLAAWAQLSVYDQTANSLKRNFVRVRWIVIGLTLTASISSILASVILQAELALFLAFISIVIPFVASFLLDDNIRFSGATHWIKCRYTAEMMRMHIYLFRMKAGDYAVGPAQDMDEKLTKNLSIIRDEGVLEQSIVNEKKPKGKDGIVAAIKRANFDIPEDDGLSEIPIDNYIKWRIEQQSSWYESSIHGDFNRLKLFVRAAKGFLLFGSLVTALSNQLFQVTIIQVVALVAVTNAISNALTRWSNVRMIGKTYSIFQIAMNKLDDEGQKWNNFTNNIEFQNADTRAVEIANLAVRVEKVLLWERHEWYEAALQTHRDNDQGIADDLTRLKERADKAQEQSNK